MATTRRNLRKSAKRTTPSLAQPLLVVNAQRIEQLKARDKAIKSRLATLDREYESLEEETARNVSELADLVRQNDNLSRF
jgi:predicted  nucleic acid-binding Zn-ribbon protein